MPDSADTIFAFATGSSKSAISILRVSGSRCRELVHTFLGACPRARIASLRDFVDPKTRRVLDRVIVLWFPGPQSFTGEDCLEIHCHGGFGVRGGLLSAISQFGGCRFAEAGEFTLRAFKNGKIDLSGVEGLAELLDAKTSGQVDLAIGLASGGLSNQAVIWRENLVGMLARLFAVIDFADEGDVQDFDHKALETHCTELLEDMERFLLRARRSEVVRAGLRVALCGDVNVGKSSLLNALAKREVAIVSSQAGTTRDSIEVELDLDGFLVRVIDTAGFRETSDEVEQIGIDRAVLIAEHADVVLWLSDRENTDLGEVWAGKMNRDVMFVRSKIDLSGSSPKSRSGFELSSLTGEGIDDLLVFLGSEASRLAGGRDEDVFASNRQIACLERAVEHVRRVRTDCRSIGVELLAEELGNGALEIGRIAGAIDVEDVLGEVFSRFCIGK